MNLKQKYLLLTLSFIPWPVSSMSSAMLNNIDSLTKKYEEQKKAIKDIKWNSGMAQEEYQKKVADLTCPLRYLKILQIVGTGKSDFVTKEKLKILTQECRSSDYDFGDHFFENIEGKMNFYIFLRAIKETRKASPLLKELCSSSIKSKKFWLIDRSTQLGDIEKRIAFIDACGSGNCFRQSILSDVIARQIKDNKTILDKGVSGLHKQLIDELYKHKTTAW